MLKTHRQKSGSSTRPGTRIKKGSKGHEEEQQPDRTSLRKEGKGQEEPRSKGKMQDRRRQKEKRKQQGGATEREKPEAIARAQGYVVKESAGQPGRGPHVTGTVTPAIYLVSGKEGRPSQLARTDTGPLEQDRGMGKATSPKLAK